MLSPVTVCAILVQNLWKNGFDWDTSLPVDIVDQWSSIASGLILVLNSSFQRRYFTSQTTDDNNTLHVFADASIRAYGAVAYVTPGSESFIVRAKNRVAPLKEITPHDWNLWQLSSQLAWSNTSHKLF